MNSTLFSIKGGVCGSQGAKPVRQVERAAFLKHTLPALSTQVRVLPNERSEGIGGVGSGVQPSPSAKNPAGREGSCERRALSVPQGHFLQVEGSDVVVT